MSNHAYRPCQNNDNDNDDDEHSEVRVSQTLLKCMRLFGTSWAVPSLDSSTSEMIATIRNMKVIMMMMTNNLKSG